MTANINSEVEGVTTFALCCDAYFRYRISLKNEKMNLWLEDRSSKKQWQSGFLCIEDYVTAANVFADASAADYVSYFQQCLECSSDSSSESQRKLISLKDDHLQVEMCIKIRLLLSVHEIKYVFKLQPVTVDRVDILEAKLKDQQEELEKLRGQGGQRERAFVHAERVTWGNALKLQWESINSENFSLGSDVISIIFRTPGLYTISVLVNHRPLENTAVGSISLEKSGIKKNELIAVACTGSFSIRGHPSYLTAVRMGD
ncbi:hypothetical protein L917_02746 [Phytophthora nicotianae]|uniref:Uncharacterized protein n=1 Tax=Phytophthora nicotianae TaxID=4792 RepID=W2LV19_PHYNI|nr:hypothetical protein L917_02746 [Phytophthora nicotianae]